MQRPSDRHIETARQALLAAGIVLLAGLAACGRKGPLEPPPGEVVEPARSGQEQTAPQPDDRRIILDNLI